MRKGNAAFEAGNYAEALEAYTEADVSSQADDPRLPQLYNNMGTTLYRQGRYDQAAAMYQKALEASQNNAFKADALFNSGNSQFKLGDYQKALEAYDRALKENPQHGQALQNKQMVAQLIEQQQQQEQEQEQEQKQNQQQQQNQEEQHDEPAQDQQPQPNGSPTPQPTPTANPAEPQPQDQQAQEAQPAEERAEKPEQELSEEEALRILDALMEKEQLQQEQRQVPPRPVEKDW